MKLPRQKYSGSEPTETEIAEAVTVCAVHDSTPEAPYVRYATDWDLSVAQLRVALLPTTSVR